MNTSVCPPFPPGNRSPQRLLRRVPAGVFNYVTGNLFEIGAC